MADTPALRVLLETYGGLAVAVGLIIAIFLLLIAVVGNRFG